MVSARVDLPPTAGVVPPPAAPSRSAGASGRAGRVGLVDVPKTASGVGPESVGVDVVDHGQTLSAGKDQGHGVGSDLLLSAFLVVARAAELVGVRAIVTHPLNFGLTGFYGRYGFEHFTDPNYELSMYMLMKKVRGTLRSFGML
jgi:hypothetical protein